MTRGRATGGRVRLGNELMPAADRLRMFIGWQIRDVEVKPNGVVVSLVLPGYTYNPPRRLLLKDITNVRELVAATRPEPEPDWEQLQIDIGDEVYERSRYDEHDIDVEPDREATKGDEPI